MNSLGIRHNIKQYNNSLMFNYRQRVILYILSQSSNATRKGPEFYATNCYREVDVGEISQLILKNLYRTEKTLSGTGFYFSCCLIGHKRILGLRTL